MMTKLTQESLEDAIRQINSMIDDKGNPVNLKPTTLLYRPSDFEDLGITVEDAMRILKQ